MRAEHIAETSPQSPADSAQCIVGGECSPSLLARRAVLLTALVSGGTIIYLMTSRRSRSALYYSVDLLVLLSSLWTLVSRSRQAVLRYDVSGGFVAAVCWVSPSVVHVGERL